MTARETLKDFFQSKGIQTALLSEPEYCTLNAFYQLQDPKNHVALVRPRNKEEVSIVVKYATANEINIVVRSGGGDLFGRSQAEGALSVDMRLINSVTVSPDRATVTVGGGCVVGEVATVLSQHGLVTPLPPIPSIGYTGWATLGGYGPFAPHFGLGVDQIVGARVVNAKGEIVDADKELLKGIRGGGGNFGIIVQLEIKVYPLQKIQSGFILFESTRGIPAALGVQPAVFNTGDHGNQFGLIAVGSSVNSHSAQTYLDKLTTLGKVIMKTVKEITVPEWMEGNRAIYVYGYNTSVSVGKITDEISEVIGRNLVRMPTDTSTMFSWHEVRGPSTLPHADSIFSVREPHYVLELLGSVTDPTNLNASTAWANTFRDELCQCRGVLAANYISLTRPSETTLEGLYGPNLATLRTLKKRDMIRMEFSILQFLD